MAVDDFKTSQETSPYWVDNRLILLSQFYRPTSTDVTIPVERFQQKFPILSQFSQFFVNR